MPGLRKIRESILMSYINDEMDDVEFCILYDENQSLNPDFPYWTYGSFELEIRLMMNAGQNFVFIRSISFD